MNLDHEHLDEIMIIAEKLQAEMHVTIDYIQTTNKEKKLDYHSLETSYYLMKMADLERKINILEQRITDISTPTIN